MLVNPLNLFSNLLRPSIGSVAVVGMHETTIAHNIRESRSYMQEQQKTANQAGLDAMAGLADAVNGSRWLA